VAQGGRVTELAARYNLPAMYCKREEEVSTREVDRSIHMTTIE
jgi:hypothetical protein